MLSSESSDFVLSLVESFMKKYLGRVVSFFNVFNRTTLYGQSLQKKVLKVIRSGSLNSEINT